LQPKNGHQSQKLRTLHLIQLCRGFSHHCLSSAAPALVRCCYLLFTMNLGSHKWKGNNPTCFAISLSLFHSVVSVLPHAPEQRCDEPCCRPILCTTYVEYPLCSVVTLLPLADQDRCKACSIPAASNLWAVEKCTRFIFITTELGSQHVFVAIYCDLWVGKTPSTHTPKQVTRLGSS
jgi:hypothetical protein